MALKDTLAAIGNDLEKTLTGLQDEAEKFGAEQEKARADFQTAQDKTNEAKIAELIKREGEARDEAQKATDAAIDANDKEMADLKGGSDLLAIIRNNEPDAAVKLTKMADIRALAKEMSIPTARKKEIDLVTEIKAAL